MDETTLDVMELDIRPLTTREVNKTIRQAIASGQRRFRIIHSEARHNLVVGVTEPSEFLIQGDLGYYAFAMCDGINAKVQGNVGWGVGENLMSGEIIVAGNAGSSSAPTLRGGVVVIRGDSGPRTGIAMKGGTVVVGGDVGYMTGFMMQKGTMIILGNAGPGLGDSMYAGNIFVAGDIAGLGNDTKIEEVQTEEHQAIARLLQRYEFSMPRHFRKIVSAGGLHHFDKKEMTLWKTAL